jgi:hypothetical protein
MKTPLQEIFTVESDLTYMFDSDQRVAMAILEYIRNNSKDLLDRDRIGYTKEDVLKACEMGEINHHDTAHIVSLLDEAKEYNKTYE